MKKIGFVIFHLILFLILCYLAYFKVVISDSWTLTITIISIIMLLIQLLTLLSQNQNYLTYSFWFILLSHIFMFGRIYLNALQLDNTIFWNLLPRYDPNIMIKSAYFILLSIQASFLGILTGMLKFASNNRENTITGYSLRLYHTGIILLSFSLPIKLLVDYRSIISSLASSSYSSEASSSGLLITLSLLILPGILSILFSKHLSRKNADAFIFISILYLLFPLIFTGDRRYGVIIIICIVLAYIKVYNIKFNIKFVLFGSYFSIVFLNLLMVIRNQRLQADFLLSSFFKDNWKDIFWGTDFLTETLAEFGLSFFSVVNIFSLIPTQIDFYKGYTFFAMIPTIFPIGWAFPEFFAKASISNIVNPIIGYPVGATMFGDFYGNFSYIGGILACFLFAYIFTVSFTPKFKDVGLSNTIYYSMFFVYTNLIRATFFEMFRSFFILIVITIVVYKLTKTKGELIV